MIEILKNIKRSRLSQKELKLLDLYSDLEQIKETTIITYRSGKYDYFYYRFSDKTLFWCQPLRDHILEEENKKYNMSMNFYNWIESMIKKHGLFNNLEIDKIE